MKFRARLTALLQFALYPTLCVRPLFRGGLTPPLPMPPIPPRPWSCIGGPLPALLEPWAKGSIAIGLRGAAGGWGS